MPEPGTLCRDCDWAVLVGPPENQKVECHLMPPMVSTDAHGCPVSSYPEVDPDTKPCSKFKREIPV